MTIKQINGIIKKLDWKETEATLFSTERDDAGFEVCEASLEDWERYVMSDNQALVSRAMAFEDGKSYIVELPSGTYDNHLRSRGSSNVESLRKLEHDCSFGPAPGIVAIRPSGMTWIEYILCIRISPALQVCQYKRYTVDNRANPLPHMDPIAIVNPTNVTFNSRRLLSLIGRGRTPQGFSRPNVVIDLFPLVEMLIQENQ
ncbi:Hypothetical protein PHPALM_13415 [Phytophthora palmivora]|uniref:Uncharacterized protein n=1 Tax=Phytophthora palmivora TaxID=4796 RepID=A0A2P4XXB7_9STRA|nr:Hypothetical protein PHPALM_13415 [Phytophthora palmivora]